MQNISLLVLTGLAAVTACPGQTLPTQGPWQQCGGINWTGGTTCVAGWTCVPQANNPYYSQCQQVEAANAPGWSSSSSTTTVTTTTKVSSKPAAPATASSEPAMITTTTTTSVVKAISTSSSSSSTTSSQTPLASSLVSGTLKSSFTFYGAGDSFGSANCQTNTAACGFFTSPGFAAAASQNLFGVGPGAGAGPACGTCWKLTGETDSSGNPLTNAGNSIIVMVNNLCPAQGNPLCAQSGLTGTNQIGANVNFDLCADSGAKEAFFGDDGVGLALGTAVQVSCSEYSGTVVH